MSDISYCAIATLIPDPLRTSLVALSSRCERDFGSWYVLSSKRFPPHLTLWLAYIPSRNMERSKAVLRHVAKETTPLTLEFTTLIVEDSGFVSLGVVLTDSLSKIHWKLLNSLNDIREGYTPEKYRERFTSFPPEQQESVSRYGTRFAGPLYAPHLTLGIIKREDVAVARSALNISAGGVVSVKTLTLFRQGEEGRSIEILEEVELM